jgi:hypothetical protein
MTNLSIIETWCGRFDWCRTSFVIRFALCWWWKRRMWMWIRASKSKVPLYFIIVAFLARWGPSLASIGTLEGKVTMVSTMEANFGSLFIGGWSCIRDQCRRAMYTWIGAPIEIVTLLPAIVVLPFRWGLCGIMSSLWSLHLLTSHNRGMEVLRVLDTLGSGNTCLSWLILWVSLWTLIYIMSLFIQCMATQLSLPISAL